jgi:hypothetical protein
MALFCFGTSMGMLFMSFRPFPQLTDMYFVVVFFSFPISTETEPQAETCGAHDSAVWDFSWHPMGHILVSSGNDCGTRYDFSLLFFVIVYAWFSSHFI